MRNSLSDVVAAAVRVLDAHGLEFCSMRRVAAELDVQPSALYHHVPNKQELLALMADEITRDVSLGALGVGVSALGLLGASNASNVDVDGGAEGGAGASAGAGVGVGADAVSGPEVQRAARALCGALRDAMLAVQDGADVVATASAYRLGASRVETELASLVGADGARTLLLFTFGHAQATQAQRQAIAFGALTGAQQRVDGLADPARIDVAADQLEASYARGLDIILAGLPG